MNPTFFLIDLIQFISILHSVLKAWHNLNMFESQFSEFSFTFLRNISLTRVNLVNICMAHGDGAIWFALLSFPFQYKVQRKQLNSFKFLFYFRRLCAYKCLHTCSHVYTPYSITYILVSCSFFSLSIVEILITAARRLIIN